MPGIRFQSRSTQFTDDNGVVAAGAKIYFYVSGTSTPQTTWSDEDLVTENDNPIECDADGRMPVDVFFDPALSYRVKYDLADDTSLSDDDDPAGGNDVSSALAAHNADPLAHLTATETQRGMVSELANSTEVQAGVDTSRVVTPAGLASLTATDTRAGLAERATAAEVEAGTDDARFSTPLGLQSLHATAAEIVTGVAGDKHFMGPDEFAQNITKAATGSLKFPGGLEFKWGLKTSTTDAPETFTFAAPFATAVYAVLTTRHANNVTAEIMMSTTTPPTVAGFTVDRDAGIVGSTDFYFFAIGS